MGDNNSQVRFEGTMTLAELRAYLEEFAASVRGGTVRVEAGDEQIVLSPADIVTLAVEAKTKDQLRSVRFELSWA